MDLQSLLEKTVGGLGFELVDVELSARGRLIRVFIDKPEAQRGVDVEDCATVSNQLTRLFLVENVDYDRLEVSSPGLDRVLKKDKDYLRFVGSEVQVKVRTPVNGRRNFNGVLLGLEADTVRLQVDAVEVRLDRAQIEKARLVPRFD